MNILTGKNEIPKQVRNDKVKRKMTLFLLPPGLVLNLFQYRFRGYEIPDQVRNDTLTVTLNLFQGLLRPLGRDSETSSE